MPPKGKNKGKNKGKKKGKPEVEDPDDQYKKLDGATLEKTIAAMKE